MRSEDLFAMALQLEQPWLIKNIEMLIDSSAGKELHIYLDFPVGSTFKNSKGSNCKVYDTSNRIWQHLNFFEHKCYLHARLPRLIDPNDKSIETSTVNWARANSGFTLLFEAYTMLLLEHEMPVNKIGKTLSVYPKRIWTIFKYWVSDALSNVDLSEVTNVGFDETSVRKGHDYVSIAVDIDTGNVIYGTPGKDTSTLDRLAKHLSANKGNPLQIKNMSIDMSPAFIFGVKEHLPNANITFDKFHVTALLQKAMDEVRKAELRIHAEIKGTKYLFLKNEDKQSQQAIKQKYEFIELFPILGKAYRLKEIFNDFWAFKDVEQAKGFLTFWLDMVKEADIIPFKKFAKTVEIHFEGIINHIKTGITNAILESINAKVQLAKKRARGYRNIDNFISMIYFIAGNLKFNYPQYTT